jgi:proline dehydrogenase
MRGLVTSLASFSIVESFFEKGVGRAFAARFVAGERLPEALAQASSLVTRGYRVALDHLGESVDSVEDARAAAAVYLETIRQAKVADIPVSLSLKPSQFGLDLSTELCAELVGHVAQAAAKAAIGVRLDMEDSRRTDGTLQVWRSLKAGGIRVGVVLQAALYRTPSDLEEVLASGGSVRLCKGAYAEPASVAYPKKADVDRAYETMLDRLTRYAGRATDSDRGYLPLVAVATHDERLVRLAIDLAYQRGISPSIYELQMLFGVRRDLQQALVARGYPLRVYAPWGRSWYPYLSRRLAERPANVAFVVSALVKDYFGSRPSSAKVADPPDCSSRRIAARARR